MFKNIEELVSQAEKQNKKIYEIMIEQEITVTEQSEEEILCRMNYNFKAMKDAADKGVKGVISSSGMTGGDAKTL